ncbi:MAG: hypothetical protein ACTSQF_05480 [Candidatus Heimdallarchaeaceae archaeon]
MRNINDEPNKGVFISSIITGVGAFLLVIGLVVPYMIRPNMESYPLFIANSFSYDGDYYYSLRPMIFVILTTVIIIMLVSILTALRNSTSPYREKLRVFGKPNFLFFLLAVFFLVPMLLNFYGYYYFIISTFSPMISVIADLLSNAGDYVTEYSMRDPGEASYTTYGPGFFFLLFGIILLLFAFFIISFQTIGTWKKNNQNVIKPSTETTKTSKFDFYKIILIIAAVCCFGMFLGVAAPTYMWLDRNPPSDLRYDSLMFYENEHNGAYKTFMNVNAFVYFLIYLFLFVSIILYLIRDKLSWEVPVNKVTISFFLIIATLLPYPNPMGLTMNWVPSLGILLFFFDDQFYYSKREWLRYNDGSSDVARVMSPIGWLFILSIGILIAVSFLIIGTTVLEKYLKKTKSKPDE